MRTGRGKVLALGSMALAGAIAALCLVASWKTLGELWILRQFDSGDAETRHYAAGRLVEKGSLLAMPRFLELLSNFGENPAEGVSALIFLQKIIDRRGRAAEPYLAHHLREAQGSHLRVLAGLTLKNFPHDPAALEAISRAMGEEDPDQRDRVLELLQAYGEDPLLCLEPALGSPCGAARSWAAARIVEIREKRAGRSLR